MFSKKKMRMAAAGAITIATVLVASGAASAIVQGNGSAGAVYLYDGAGQSTTNSTVFAYNADAIGSSSAANQNGSFTCSNTSLTAAVFLAPSASQSNATTKGSWTAYAELGNLDADKLINTPNLNLSFLNKGSTTFKDAGGSFYLGVACLNNGGLTVTSANYRTISMNAGGAWSTTDTILTNQFRVTTQPQSQTVAAGANVTFTAAFGGTEPTSGTNIEWQKAESGSNVFAAVSPAVTTGTLVINNVTVADDNGDRYKARVSNDNGVNWIDSDLATLTVSATVGSVDMNAPVVQAVDGTLSLSVPANASVTFGAATLVSNFSTSVGNLPNITVNDARVQSRPGWNLTATVTDFTYQTNTISKSQLGFTPTFVSATAAGTSVGAALTAGAANWASPVLATGLANNDVGNTIINGELKFVAPQKSVAGTYTSKMTLTVASK
jgi:hypothetical protein